MAGRDVFNFDITANSQKAKEAFEELKRLSDELENITVDVKSNPESSKNMTDLVVKMTEVIRTHSELSKIMDEEHTIQFHTNNKDLAKEIKQSMKMVDDATKRMNRTAESAKNVRQTKTGKKFRYLDDLDDYKNGPSDTRKELNRTKDFSKKLKRELNQGMSIGQNAMNSGYINSAQASNYRQISGDLLGSKYQGGSREDVLKEGFQPEKGSQRYESAERIEKARENIAEKKVEIGRVASSDSIGDEETKLKIMQQMEKEMKDQVSILNEHQSIIQTLDAAVERLGGQADELNLKAAKGQAPREKDDRNSMWGRMYERASAIAMAVAGAATYTMASSYANGRDLTKATREDSLNIGYRTGDNDFRGIRQDQMENGAEMGWKGKDMLAFADSVLSTAGFQNKEQYDGLTNSVAEGSKYLGVGKEGTTDFMETMFKTGGVSTADQAKSIQEGFLGAIKASGMEGREKEQLAALGAINANLFMGREATNQEIESRMAMLSVLSGTGDRAFQGENLANFMTGADDQIKEADMTSTLGMLLGAGTDPEFMGEDGRYNFKKMQQEGLTTESYNKIVGKLSNATGGDAEATAALMDDVMPSDVPVESMKELIEKYPNGLPEGEELQKVLDTDKTVGGDQLAKNKENYMESDDQSSQAADAYAEKMDTLLNDNKLIGALDNLREGINDMGSNNMWTAVGMTMGAGLLSGIGTALGSVVWSALTPIVSKISSTAFTGAAGGGTGGNLIQRAGQLFKGPGSLASKAKDVFGKGGTTAASTAGSMADDVAGGLGGLADDAVNVAGTAAKGASKAGGWFGGVASKMPAGLSKLGNIAGKVAVPLGMLLSGVSIAKADDKVNETSKQAGGWAGGAAGGALGFALGGPLGAILGGIAGSIGGNFAGGKAEEGISSVWDNITGKDNKVEAAELTPEEQASLENSNGKNETTATQTEEQALATNKLLTEKMRQANTSDEAENLSFMETLLGRISELLDRAKAQNGIIGLTDGLEGGTDGSSTGVGGELDYTGNGDYWTNEDIRQHDLASTTNALTAEDLDKWIESSTQEGSLMRGMGQTFLEAGAESGLDPRYLVAHAGLETGWGDPNNGYAKDGNFFGIGAFDNNPDNAKNYDLGIKGGAKWIAENYYQNGQTNLDSMRNNGGNHEYATDPNWDEKIASIMKGSEKYTSPSVNVSTNINYTGTGDPEKDGKIIGNSINNTISSRYTKETVRT